MTKILKKVVLLMTIAVPAYSDTTVSKIKEMMQRPLIVGASVSGDYFTASPGKRLALRYTKADQIKVHAMKGKPGREVLKTLNEKDFEKRTAIIGLDLFFWDSFAPNAKASEQALDQLITTAKKNNIPVILGEVPVFMPSMQPAAIALNQKIHEVCKRNKDCYVLHLNDLLVKTFTDGYIMQNGRKYSIADLLPDGLHIATPASEFLADHIAVTIGKP